MVGGQHHRMSARYLHQYASEAAFKEDHCRLSNGVLAERTLRLALTHKVSRNWKGYWQRAKAPAPTVTLRNDDLTHPSAMAEYQRLSRILDGLWLTNSA